MIYPKPIKKRLKIHRGLWKAAGALVIQMKTEKIGLEKFLNSRKVRGFDSAECPCKEGLQSAKQMLTEFQAHIGKKKQDVGGRHKKSGLW